MYIRKNLAFVSSTYPWVWGSFITWWMDRLFVEFGHRVTSSPLCNHSNIQYVTLHCYITVLAIGCQTIYSIHTRAKQFKREEILLGLREEETPSCRILCFIIYLLQLLICFHWAIVVACLADVSPWLCNDFILEHRASIAVGAFGAIAVLVYSEQCLYTYVLKRVLVSTTFEI